jgi:hypothetical protein
MFIAASIIMTTTTTTIIIIIMPHLPISFVSRLTLSSELFPPSVISVDREPVSTVGGFRGIKVPHTGDSERSVTGTVKLGDSLNSTCDTLFKVVVINLSAKSSGSSLFETSIKLKSTQGKFASRTLLLINIPKHLDTVIVEIDISFVSEATPRIPILMEDRVYI